MNRFKFEAAGVRKVIDHLRQGAKITAADIGLPKWAQKLKKPAVRSRTVGMRFLRARSRSWQ